MMDTEGKSLLDLASNSNELDEKAVQSCSKPEPELTGNLQIDPLKLHSSHYQEEGEQVDLSRVKSQSHETDETEEVMTRLFPFLSLPSKITNPESKILGLGHHLRSIQKQTEIPQNKLNLALDILQDLQNVLNITTGKSQLGAGIHYKVDISRHWLLNLIYAPGGHNSENRSCPIVIHKYDSNGDYQKGIRMGELKELEKLFLSRESPNLGMGQKKMFFLSYETTWNNYITGPSGYGTLLYTIAPIKPHQSFTFSIEIDSSPMRLVELQVWRLLEYLCTFDPHCRPLLAVAYYWARCNSVTFGFGRRKGCPPCYLPDPNGLNWLLMVFLHMEGLIPSPKMILEQPHKILKVMSTDVGFEERTEMEVSRREIKKNGREGDGDEDDDELFAENVFRLLSKIFLFCATKLGGIFNEDNDGIDHVGWILNTRDGEILPLEELLSTDTNKITNCNLTQSELASIKVELEESGNRGKIIVLHPFKAKWRIAANNAELAFKAMKETGTRLKDHFDKVGNGQSEKLALNEFLNLLRI